MNSVLSQLSPSSRLDVSLAGGEFREGKIADVRPATLDDLAHELRQPLSVIESIAYYLELTSDDQAMCAHLQRIRAMVNRANSILETSCA
jgi:signal transduction histidine kinase